MAALLILILTGIAVAAIIASTAGSGAAVNEHYAPRAARPRTFAVGHNSIEFQIRHVNGCPEFGQFRQYLPLHGDYEFEHINGFSDRYHFRITRDGSLYRVNIIDQPSYGNRRTDVHSTHRLGLGSDSPPQICIKDGHHPHDLPTAAAIAVWWAQRTSQYIRDGREWS